MRCGPHKVRGNHDLDAAKHAEGTASDRFHEAELGVGQDGGGKNAPLVSEIAS